MAQKSIEEDPLSLEEEKYAELLYQMASIFAKKRESQNLEHALFLSERGLTIRERNGNEPSEEL